MTHDEYCQIIGQVVIDSYQQVKTARDQVEKLKPFIASLREEADKLREQLGANHGNVGA